MCNEPCYVLHLGPVWFGSAVRFCQQKGNSRTSEESRLFWVEIRTEIRPNPKLLTEQCPWMSELKLRHYDCSVMDVLKKYSIRATDGRGPILDFCKFRRRDEEEKERRDLGSPIARE
jgi:hypothetical protein